MTLNKDVIIVGGGFSSLIAAYKLRKNNTELPITIVEQGKSLEKRKCFASKDKECVHCKSCSIVNGVGGSGTFSDSKFSYMANKNSVDTIGGTLPKEIGGEQTYEYIQEVLEILNEFSYGTKNIEYYNHNKELITECLKHNLRMLEVDTVHFGSENGYIIMKNLIDWLIDNNVKIISDTKVEDVFFEQIAEKYNVVYKQNNKVHSIFATHVILATGRTGADFIKDFCDKNKIETECGGIDIGVRVEMKNAIWENFTSKIYEPKIYYKTKTFEDNVRMFCTNPGGIVAAENNDGIITANGYSFASSDLKTDNINFALLTHIELSYPFDNPTEFSKNICQLSNLLGGDNVLVQRFGDLIRGRRTTEHRLAQNSVIPTLKAAAGDISLVLPHRILTDIIETIQALNNIAQGTSNDDTLLYACEAKFYSLKPKHNEKFEIMPNIYLCGDGSGFCRGLSQSGASALVVANDILKK